MTSKRLLALTKYNIPNAYISVLAATCESTKAAVNLCKFDDASTITNCHLTFYTQETDDTEPNTEQ